MSIDRFGLFLSRVTTEAMIVAKVMGVVQVQTAFLKLELASVPLL